MSSPTSVTLRAVRSFGEGLAFAVGDAGTILRYNGSSWATMTSPTTPPLNALWGASPAQVHAVGADGTILLFDGTSWTVQPSPTTSDLVSIWGSSAANVYAAGSNGILLHYDGATWEAIASPPGEITALWGRSARDLWAITSSNQAWSFDGSSWAKASVAGPVYSTLTGIFGALHGDSSVGLIAGDSGLTYSDAVDFQVARPFRFGGECAGPIPIYCETKVFGDTDGASVVFDDYPGCSGLRPQPGREVTYRLESPVAGTISARLTPHTSDLDLVVLGADVRGGCDRAGSCLGFGDEPSLNPEEVTVHAMPGDVLFIVVDGPSDVAGAGYTLEATCARDL